MSEPTDTTPARREHPFRTAKRLAFHARKVAAEGKQRADGSKVLPVGRRGQVLLLAIALFVDAAGTTSLGSRGGPSQRLLGAVVGYSERAVRMAVQELEAAGLCERDVPGPAARREGCRTEYRIPLWTWRPAPGDTASSVADARGPFPGGGRAAVAAAGAATILHDPKGAAAAEGRQRARQASPRPLFERSAAAVAKLAAQGPATAPRGVSLSDRQPLPVPSGNPTGSPLTPEGGGGTDTPGMTRTPERVPERAAAVLAKMLAAQRR